jgi:hypothetical protein
MDTPVGHEISKVHTVILQRSNPQGQTWVIEDNSSMNGTFVNLRKIQRRLLNSGDEIVFGGGPNFREGDLLESAEKAYCRYSFFTVDPVVRFSRRLDPNAVLQWPEADELCSICYALMESPEVLPCGHVFCLKCIQQWAQACQGSFRNIVCPMCRTVFLQSQLRCCETRLVCGELEVLSVEGMLRDLNVKSCRILKSVNIFKCWTEHHKKWFWKWFEQVSRNPDRRVIFLHLTKATVRCILAASSEELNHALINFELDVTEDKNEMVRKLLLFLLMKLIPQKK